MKLVHISDLHIDAINKKNNLSRARKVLEYISDTGYDHLIITGDITENGDKDSFELTRKLLKKFGMLDETKTSLVIGNHDIYGGVHLAEDIVNFPKKCKYTDYISKVKEFEHYFSETFSNTYRPVKNGPFPYVKEFDNFIIVGLNSIAKYSVLKNPFASNGIINRKQFRELERILGSPLYTYKKKIVLIHHHFCRDTFRNEESGYSLWNRIEHRTMKLYGKKNLIKLLKKYDTEMVLHGHLHETRKYFRKGLTFLNGGGSILNNEKNLLRINFIKIENSKITSEIHSINPAENRPSFIRQLYPKSALCPVINPHPTETLVRKEIHLN